MKPHNESERQPVRLGVIGLGGIARQRHIPGFKAIPGVEIVSVANRTKESSERAAREFDIPHVYPNWLELVAAEDTDAILVSAWPHLHYIVTQEALECNKHVLCQARMAMSANEAHAMLDSSRRHPHLVTQLAPAPYTLSMDDTIIRLIADGFLGELISLDGRFISGGFPDRDAPLHWRNRFDLSGFNTMSLGIWYEALLRWIGPARRITAMAQTYVKQRRGESGWPEAVTIPDHLDVTAEFLCGAAGRLRFSSVCGLAPSDELWLFGSEGTLRLDIAAGGLYGGKRGQQKLEVIPVAKEDGWRAEEEFIASIRTGAPVTRTSFEDGVRYMEFTEAALRSAQTGQTISLPF